MKTIVTQDDFIRAFDKMDRSDNFSIEGRMALFDWIEQMDEDCNHETTLDVISLCCEFTEYKDLTEFRSDYPHVLNYHYYIDMAGLARLSRADLNQAARDEISDRTTLIPINDKSFIIQSF
jgi:hypothetical protein|tara:strand:+ start:473 stop:835 length:363 start_codon:yes stop_codon:yes gene_type:complete